MPTPSLAPIALYTIGPFEVVGPVGESDPFPELHATLETSRATGTIVRIRCFMRSLIYICVFCGPGVFCGRSCARIAPRPCSTDYTDKADDKSREALDTLLPSVDAE